MSKAKAAKFKIEIAEGVIGAADLAKFVAGWKTLVPYDNITIGQTVTVATDSVQFKAALQALLATRQLNGATPVRGKSIMLGRGNETMGKASVRIEKTGTVISTRELNRRLAAQELDELTVIVTAKGERKIVVADDDGNLSLAKEPQA
jgi:hypothetical protein